MTHADRVLADCERLAVWAGLTALAERLATARARAGQPMRVAIVGQIKRGKSTVVNALLGADVAPTGQLEATFTVSEFHDADTSGVTVHYKNPDRPPLSVPIDEFRRFTINDPAQAEALREIRTVEYGLPNPLLKTFRLVDTPGLASVYGADSDNTLDVLGVGGGFLDNAEEERLAATLHALRRSADDIHRDSVHEIQRADAVIYLFDRALGERDIKAVGDFLGPANGMNPLKSFGVLSRCDQHYWPPVDVPDADPLTYDPIAVARGIVDGYLRKPRIRRTFYTVLPVAGLVAMGAQVIGDDHFTWLADLARVDSRRLAAQLSDANRFATMPKLNGIELPGAQRKALVETLGAWGTLRATQYLRDGLPPDQVRERLVADSGVAVLRETIIDHFGNRSGLLKLDSGLREVTLAVTQGRLTAQRVGATPPAALDTIADHIQDLHTRLPGRTELAVLAAHYNGDLSLSDAEVTEVLRVTGEHGWTAPARLGLPESTPLAQLAAAARLRVNAWAHRANDLSYDRRTAAANREIRNCYERLAWRIDAARTLLETDDDLETER